MNPVNSRLGRNQHTARAQRKRIREVANQLAKETDWRGDLARSFKQLSPDDEFEEAYISGEHSHNAK